MSKKWEAVQKPKAVCKEALVKLGKYQKALAERLLAVCDADELDADLQRQLALVMEIFNGFGEAPPPGRRAKREKGPSDDLFGMSRC